MNISSNWRATDAFLTGIGIRDTITQQPGFSIPAASMQSKEHKRKKNGIYTTIFNDTILQARFLKI